jgi:hypothetical protein
MPKPSKLISPFPLPSSDLIPLAKKIREEFAPEVIVAIGGGGFCTSSSCPPGAIEKLVQQAELLPPRTSPRSSPPNFPQVAHQEEQHPYPFASTLPLLFSVLELTWSMLV